MRFSLVIKPYNDTITEYVSSMDARTDVIFEGRECLVNGLKALGGTRVVGGPLDLFGDETIQLTRQIKELQDLSNAHTDFTQQFTIPSTPTNDPIFQNYFDENILLDGWNAFLKLDAAIYIHGLPVFDGCIELTGVEFKNGLPRQYNIVFYGQSKKAIADWGEKILNQVDWSAYNHTVSYANVVSSWAGGLLSGKIMYPVADWHLGMQYCKVPVVENNLYDQGLSVNDLRPAILLKEMVTACFADIGYTLIGSLFDRDNFDDLFVIPQNAAGPIQNPANENAKINVNSNVSLTFNQNWQGQKVIFNTEVSDPLNAYDTTTGVYRVPLNGEFTMNVSGDCTTFNATAYVRIYNSTGQSVFYQPILSTGAFSFDFIGNFNRGNRLYVEIKTSATTTINNFAWQITKVPFGIDGTTMNMAVVMPQIKVADFIQKFLKTYNAILVPVSDTEFELHNIDDYYATGSTKNWTEYIDITDIRHEKMPIPGRITMQHTEAEDQANVAFKSNMYRNYGSVDISPEVDFSADELNIETPFSVFVPSVIREVDLRGNAIGNTDLQIPVVLDADNKGVKADLWLYYYVGFTSTSDSWKLNNTDQFSYPLISSYNEYPTTSTSHSVAYGLEVSTSGDTPTNTMYVEFWRAYLSRLYSSKSRVVYLDAVLPVGEWLNLEMNDTIAVSSNYYKIQSIDYDMLAERAKLVLISYPDVDVQKYTSAGDGVGWTNGDDRVDGVTVLNGDSVGRAVTHGKPDLNGDVTVDNLGQKGYGFSNVGFLNRAVRELLKGINVLTVYNSSSETISVDEFNNYTALTLDTSQLFGNAAYFALGTNAIDVSVSARYKLTGMIGLDHSHGHELGVAILVNDQETLAQVNVGTTDQATSVITILDLNVGDVITLGVNSIGGHALNNIDINTARLIIETT